jgi:hypothetical protein
MSCRRAAGAAAGKPSSASLPFRSAGVYAGSPNSLPRWIVRATVATSPRGREDARAWLTRPRHNMCAHRSAPTASTGPERHSVRQCDLGDRRARQCFAEAGVRWSGCEFARAPRAAMRPVGKARRPRILGICKGGATPPNGMQRRPNAEPTRDRTTGTSEQTLRRSGAGAGKHRRDRGDATPNGGLARLRRSRWRRAARSPG